MVSVSATSMATGGATCSRSTRGIVLRSGRTAWSETLADLGAPAAQMYAFDADGDGDRDIVSSSAHDYGLWYHEQVRDSSGATRWIHTRSTTASR